MKNFDGFLFTVKRLFDYSHLICMAVPLNMHVQKLVLQWAEAAPWGYSFNKAGPESVQ